MSVTSKAGVKLAQTWAAAWVAVDTMIPLVSETISPKYDQLVSEALIGQASLQDMELGTQLVQGDLVVDLDYDGGTAVADLIAYGMGSRSSENITLANDLSANVFNLEFEKTQARHRIASAMISKVTISGKIGEAKPVSVTLGVVGRSYEVSATAFPALSLSASAVRAFAEHLRNTNGHFYIGDCADALSSGDAIPISSFEIVIDNNLVPDTKESSVGYVTQPIRNGFRTITLKVGVERYNSTTDNFQTWKMAGTALQAELALEESGGDDILFKFPYAKITDGANFSIPGPGMITDEITLTAYYNGSKNAYMAVTDALQVDFTSF